MMTSLGFIALTLFAITLTQGYQQLSGQLGGRAKMYEIQGVYA